MDNKVIDKASLYDTIEGARILVNSLIESVERDDYIVTADDLRPIRDAVIEAEDIVDLLPIQ